MIKINKSIVIGVIILGVLLVFGIAVWRAKEREKQIEAERQAEKQMIQKLKRLRFKTEI